MIASLTITHHNPQRDPLKLWDGVIHERFTTRMELTPWIGFYVLSVLGHSFSAVPGTKLVIEVEVK